MYTCSRYALDPPPLPRSLSLGLGPGQRCKFLSSSGFLVAYDDTVDLGLFYLSLFRVFSILGCRGSDSRLDSADVTSRQHDTRVVSRRRRTGKLQIRPLRICTQRSHLFGALIRTLHPDGTVLQKNRAPDVYNSRQHTEGRRLYVGARL